MKDDMTVSIGDCVINLRVGAIVIKDNKVLMVKNARDDYYYSVGGRIKSGETSEDAVLREVYEELGVRLPVDRLGFISENYFYGTIGDNVNRQIYEVCFYYYMKTPPDFEPRYESVTDSGIAEKFEWLPFDTEKTIYPVFFRTELKRPCETVKHIITDERTDRSAVSSGGAVYKDEKYELGEKNGRPYLKADGRTYYLSCHPYEPCLYITDENGGLTAVHNAFDPSYVLDALSRGETVSSISGFEYGARDFCEMVEYAAGKGNINIDEAEMVFSDRGKKKKPDAPADNDFIIEDECISDMINGLSGVIVEYRLVKNDCAEKGREAHRAALSRACGSLFADDEDGGYLWRYDVGKAKAARMTADELFTKEKKSGKLTYRKAFLEPPYGADCTDRDFDRVNAALFPNGTDGLEIYEWTTDWSDYFDDGGEWWGTLCVTVYDPSLDRFVVILASATD